MLDRPTDWKNLVLRPDRTVVLARLYYGDESAYLPVSSGPVELAGESYLPVIAGHPVYKQQSDVWTKRTSVADMKLSLINLLVDGYQRVSDVLETKGSGADLGFENRKADVRLWKPGITSWGNCFQFNPNGLVRDPASLHTREYITVEIQDQSGITLEKMQFEWAADTDAADSDQGLPDVGRGMIKPYVGGDRKDTRHEYDATKSTADVSRRFAPTPCIYLGQDSSDYHYWFVAGHVAYSDLYFLGWSAILNRYVPITSTITEVQNTASGCIIKHPNEPGYSDIWYGKGTVTPTTQGAGSGVFDEGRVIDKQFDVYARLEVGAAEGIGDYAKIEIPFPDYDVQSLADGTLYSQYVYLFGKLYYGGGANDGDFEVTVEGDVLNPDQYPTGAGYPEARLRRDTLIIGVLGTLANSIEVMLEKQIPANTETASFAIYELYKVVFLYFGDVLPLYYIDQGAEYGTWINDRSTADDNPYTGAKYVETHEDDDQAGEMIENPAGSLEDLVRYAGLDDSDLSEDDMNILSNDLTGLKAAPAIITQPSSYPARIAQFCQQFRTDQWWKPDGQYSAKALEDDYASDDISIPAGMFRDLKFGRSDPKRLYTAVKVRYRYDPVVSRYNSETSIVSDATAQSKYNVTQAESLLVFNAPDILDDATATAIGNYLLANQMNIHNTVEGYLPQMYLHMDMFDHFDIYDMPFLVRGKSIEASFAIAGQNIRPYWRIFALQRTPTDIWIRGTNVHELD